MTADPVQSIKNLIMSYFCHTCVRAGDLASAIDCTWHLSALLSHCCSSLVSTNSSLSCQGTQFLRRLCPHPLYTTLRGDLATTGLFKASHIPRVIFCAPLIADYVSPCRCAGVHLKLYAFSHNTGQNLATVCSIST